MKNLSTDRHQAGFTLIEILVSTLVTSVLLAGVMSLATFQVSSARDQATQVELQQSVRNVVELFAREVRRTGANPTCSEDVRALSFAGRWMINLNSDLNGNGTIEFSSESIIYQFDPVYHSFRRIADGKTETLITDISWQQSRIRYFDGEGNELTPSDFSSLSSADRDRVRRIQESSDAERHAGALAERRGS